MNYVTATVLAAIGIATAPFIRAIIFRHSTASKGEIRYACPHCGASIGHRQRLPMSGRCPSCARRIGPAPGVVEAVSAVTLALIAWRLRDPLPLAAASWAAVTGVALACIDIAVHRLPNRIVLVMLAGTALLLTAAAIVSGDYRRLGVAALCAAGTGAANLALALLPRGLGLGDVKLSVATGLLAGWFGVAAAVVAFGVALALLWLAAVATALRLMTRRSEIAHGPFILLGTLVAVMAHA